MPHAKPVKRIDNPSSAWRDLDRALHDEDEASIVPVVLADDPCFQEKARLVAVADDCLTRARIEAKSYTPHRGPHQDLIVELLIDAAKEPWGNLGAPGRRDFFANRSRRAVWAEPEALGELDPCRVRIRGPRLLNGARLLARFGAYKCINCGMAFSESGRYERGIGRRSSRRHHCDACKYKLGPVAPRQIDAISRALDATTGQHRHHRAACRAAF